jgi:hypothetical protein
MNMPVKFNIVFDGPPGHEAGRFVEVETLDGKSFKVGEWIEGLEGYWYLQIDCEEIYERGFNEGANSVLEDQRP